MAIHEQVFPLPQVFESCHASTLALLADGRLIAAWFGGTHENHPDVAIWGAVRGPDGWSEPRLLAKVAPQAHWNPVLFAPGDGSVHLFFKVGRSPRVWRTWHRRSRDGGMTWTEARQLVPGDIGGRGPVKNKPIVLSDGTWLAGASIEQRSGQGYWDVFVDRSTDGGESWQASGLIAIDHAATPGPGVIQPTLWESQPGRVHLLCRSSAGCAYRSDSEDGGLTWSELLPTDLPNNNSGLDVVRLADGRLVLIHNPTAGDWAARTPLRLAVSDDNGQTWPRRVDVETEPGEEFSYPSIIATGADSVACSYTWKRRGVCFWMGSVAEVG